MRFVLAAIAAMIVAVPAQAQDWWRAETNNFIIISRDGEEETRQFASELERFDMAMRTLQNLPIGDEQPTPATKLTVYRFGDTGDIGRMAGARGVAGFYIPRAGDSVAFTPAREPRRRSNSVTDVDRYRQRLARLDAVSVLQHEYVHYFMMQHFPAAYPSWYVEGYAELLATLRFNEDGSFHVGDVPQYRAYNMFQMSQLPLTEMLDQKAELSGRDQFQFYGTGWLLAHYLNFDAARYVQLNEYLTAIGNGEDSLTAARRIFGDLDAMDRELRQYRNGPFPGIDVAPAGYVEPAVELRPLTEVEDALVRQEMRLRRGVDEDDARDIVGDIEGSGYADTPLGLELLARAHMAAEQYEETLAVAERLMETAPGNIAGPIYASYAASELAKDDPAWMDRAVAFAAQAQDIDSDDPRPNLAYYYAYVAARQDVPENAAIALEFAYDTAGSDPAFRILLARQLLVEDRLPSAKTVLQPIAFRGHNQGGDDEDEEENSEEEDDAPPSLDDIMAEINAGERDAALTMIDELIHWEDDEDDA